MAEFKYDKTGRLLFTEEMKREYTLLIPQMLPVHFSMIAKCLEMEGFKTEILTSTHRGIADIGLRYVHNDICYPAMLVIGQLLDGLQSGRFDVNRVGLLITQTGGGCRASNYIHLLRKALIKAGLDFVPVVSLNLSGLEKNPGFKMTIPLIRRMIFSLVYGDIIVTLANQCRPYEAERGASDRMTEYWSGRLLGEFSDTGTLNYKTMVKNLDLIAADFASIELNPEPKVKVGVVGEIYVKYAPLGNNNLEQFLLDEGCEPVVPGVLDFLIFKINNRGVDVDLYGGSPIKKMAVGLMQGYAERCQRALIAAIKKHPKFRAPKPFSHLRETVRGYLGHGNKMGEGWLLTSEMLELVESGVRNIVCTQPFVCLPNHIAGKGMIRKIRDNHPEANIVAIDYDPGATKINQENRIKLMLANARRGASRRTPAPEPVPLAEQELQPV